MYLHSNKAAAKLVTLVEKTPFEDWKNRMYFQHCDPPGPSYKLNPKYVFQCGKTQKIVCHEDLNTLCPPTV